MDNSNHLILDLCGGTGSWSKPWAENGYRVINVTLPEYDVRTFELPDEPIYGILAAPPCTMFSDARTNSKTPRDLRGGMEIVIACLKLIWEAQYRTKSDQQKYPPLKFWALENPWYGRLKWFLGKPAFVFDPWEFGDMYKKRTAIWGCFAPPLKTHTLPISEVKKLKGVNNAEYWRQTKLRQTMRAITPRGFAVAFYEANKAREEKCQLI